jgi:hypothetical protein
VQRFRKRSVLSADQRTKPINYFLAPCLNFSL